MLYSAGNKFCFAGWQELQIFDFERKTVEEVADTLDLAFMGVNEVDRLGVVPCESNTSYHSGIVGIL